MKKKSLWLEGINPKTTTKLTKGITTDILIIGGGIAGISTAFELRNCGKEITLIDQNKVGFGVSAHTTGKLTFLQELIYQKLEANFGYEISKLYLQSQKEAIEIVKQNVINYHIDCNYEGVSSYVFTNSLKEIKKFQKEELFLSKNKISYQIKNKLPIKNVEYALEVKDTAVFHPVKYILELKRLCLKEKVKIYENTKAISLKEEENGYLVDTEEGYIRAKQVILCCHYPYFTIPGIIPFRTHIERSYLCAGEIKNRKKFSAISSNLPTQSLRYHKDKKNYLLYVGNSHKLGNNLDYEKNYQSLIEQSKDFFQNVDYIWQNQDIITSDYLPLIGRLQKENNRLYIATGFNTWGMTNGVIAGKVLADLIQGKSNSYEKLFAPYRGMSVDKIKNLTLDAFQNGKSYVISKIKDYYSFYLDDIKIETLNGKKVGIYIDEDGKYHIVSRICPHLKCSLTFNMFQKTWDCPCHGSRFDIDGNCIQGPSIYHIKL